jgi:hypothetical protein
VSIGNAVTSIGDYSFEGCTGLTTVTIPNSVTSIGYRAFYGCTRLASLTISKSVTEIGNYAFYDCTGLTSVTCLWNVPLSASNNVFSSATYETCQLYVPIGTESAYAGVEPWSNFYNNIIGVDLSAVPEIGEDNGTKINVENGTISIVTDADVRIVSMNGTTIYSGSGEAHVNVLPGVYIVLINNTATKVVVK